MEPSEQKTMNALILAGARASGDPLCESEKVASKAVIEIAGAPMLSYVTQALAQSSVEQPIWLLGGEADNLEAATGGVECQFVSATGAGPAGSLLAALKEGVPLPLLVTTADHPLLTPEMITHFLDNSRRSGADLCVGFAKRDTIEAAYPDTRRTYLPVGGRDLSGCNLFYLENKQAMQVLEFWKDVEQDRKHPWRIARRLGWSFLIKLLLKRHRSESVFALLSKRLGAEIKPVILPFAEAAVDVDKTSDLIMVRGIIEKRKSNRNTD